LAANNITVTDSELSEIKRIARRAGAILLSYYRSDANVDWKAPGDPVTAADRDASEYIVGELRILFPDDAILSEEEPDDPKRLSSTRVWMIDPMDGTREFIAHREDFSVMIGLIIKGQPKLGVVYQPVKDKLYSAAESLGAVLEDQSGTRNLQVSLEDTASKLTMARSRSHRSSRVDRIAETLRIGQSIAMGSVGLKVGLICEGQAHLYVHLGNMTQIWDTCAPDAILREAGGRMTDVYGNPLRYVDRDVKNKHGVIASNGMIHDRVLRVAQSVITP